MCAGLHDNSQLAMKNYSCLDVCGYDRVRQNGGKFLSDVEGVHGCDLKVAKGGKIEGWEEI